MPTLSYLNFTRLIILEIAEIYSNAPCQCSSSTDFWNSPESPIECISPPYHEQMSLFGEKLELCHSCETYFLKVFYIDEHTQIWHSSFSISNITLEHPFIQCSNEEIEEITPRVIETSQVNDWLL